MADYTVHYQKGSRVGARSLRMIQVEAINRHEAAAKAQREAEGLRAQGYRLTRIDHFDPETGELVID